MPSLLRAAWNAALHPRDKNGKFITKGSHVELPDGSSGTAIGAHQHGDQTTITVEKGNGATVAISADKTAVDTPLAVGDRVTDGHRIGYISFIPSDPKATWLTVTTDNGSDWGMDRSKVSKIVIPTIPGVPTGEAAYDSVPVPTIDAAAQAAVADYVGAGYRRINSSLRAGAVPPELAPTVAEIDSVIAASPPLPSDVAVYRGMSMRRPEFQGVTDLTGTTITDKGYLSTTTEFDTAAVFGGGELNGARAMLLVRLPAGTHAAPVSKLTNQQGTASEQELLLGRSTTFRVISDRTDAGGQRVLEATLAPATAPVAATASATPAGDSSDRFGWGAGDQITIVVPLTATAGVAKAIWDATLHPRDKNGQFIKKGSLVKLPNGQTGQVVGVSKGLGGKPKLTVDTVTGTVVHPAAISVAVTKEPLYNPGDKVTIDHGKLTGTVVATQTTKTSTIVQVKTDQGQTVSVLDTDLDHVEAAPAPAPAELTPPKGVSTLPPMGTTVKVNHNGTVVVGKIAQPVHPGDGLAYVKINHSGTVYVPKKDMEVYDPTAPAPAPAPKKTKPPVAPAAPSYKVGDKVLYGKAPATVSTITNGLIQIKFTETGGYAWVNDPKVDLTPATVAKPDPPDLTDVLKEHVPDDPLHGIKEGDAVTLPSGKVGEVVAAYPSGLLTVATSDGGTHAVGAQVVTKAAPAGAPDLTTPPKGMFNVPAKGTPVKVNYNGKVTTGVVTDVSPEDGLAYVEGPTGGQLGWIAKADLEPIGQPPAPAGGPKLDENGLYAEQPKVGDRIQTKSGLSRGVVTDVYPDGTVDLKWDATQLADGTTAEGSTSNINPIGLFKPDVPDVAPPPPVAGLEPGDHAKIIFNGHYIDVDITGKGLDGGQLYWSGQDTDGTPVSGVSSAENFKFVVPGGAGSSGDDGLTHSSGPSYTASDGGEVYEGQTVWDKKGNTYLIESINPGTGTATAKLTGSTDDIGQQMVGKSKMLPLTKFTQVTVTSDPKLNAPSAPSAGDEVSAHDQHDTALHIGDTVQMDNGTTGKVTGDTGSSWHVEVDGKDVSADSVTRLDTDPAANPTWNDKIKVKDVAGNKIANGDTVYVSSIGRKATVVGNMPPDYESETPKLVVQDPDTGENHVVPSGNVEKVTDPNVLFGQEAEDTLPRVRLTVTQVEALNDYTGSGYSAMNTELRNYEGDLVQLKADEGAHLASEVARLDAAIKKSVIPQPVMVYRGMNHTHPGNIKKGTTFRDWGFISSTTNRHIADGFGPGVLMQLSLPPGQHALSVDNNGGGAQGGGEDEILLPRGQAFFTTNVIKLNGRTIIQARPVDNPTGPVLASATMPVSGQPAQPEEKSPMERYAERLIWDPEDVEIISQADPETPVTAAASGRFTGHPGHFFGGDKKFPKGPHVSWDAVKEANPGAAEKVGHVKPGEVLFASQDHHDRKVVAAYRHGQRGPHESAPVKVFRHAKTGRKHVVNGHHRILADRLAGKATPVLYLDGALPAAAPAAASVAAEEFGIIKAIKTAWAEAMHPRDKNGRFIPKGAHVTLGDGSTGQVVGGKQTKTGVPTLTVKRDNGTVAVVKADTTTVQQKNPGIYGRMRVVHANPRVPAADLMKSIKDNGGFTYNPKTGGLLVPGKDTGIAVAVPGTEQIVGNGEVSRHDFAKGVAKVMQAHRKEIANGAKLGGWYSEDRNAYMVELTDVLPGDNRDAAIAEGKKRNQEGIFDIGANEFIPTGGTGDGKTDPPSPAADGPTNGPDPNAPKTPLVADDARAAMVEQALKDHAHLATDKQFFDPATGTWDPARRIEQNKIVDDLHAAASQVPNDHQAIIAGGLPGAGKTTILTQAAQNADPSNFLTLNPDQAKEELIKRGLAPQIPGLTPMESVALIHQESSEITKLLAARAYADGKNVTWDITMSKPKSISDRLKELRANGYHNIRGIFVSTTMDKSLANAQGRWQRGIADYNSGKSPLGGRYVPPSVGLESQSNDPQFRSTNEASFSAQRGNFDDWEVWDNAQNQKHLVTNKAAEQAAGVDPSTPLSVEHPAAPAAAPTAGGTNTPNAPPLIPAGSQLDPNRLMDIAKANPVNKDYRNMTNAEKIKATAMMYGTNSKQYQQALKKWGK